jgi:hypothetical protein
MDKFTKVTGVATPLMRQNVDTDLIIRIERLVDNVTKEGLGPTAARTPTASSTRNPIATRRSSWPPRISAAGRAARARYGR